MQNVLKRRPISMDEYLVRLRYEALPPVCFWYGHLGQNLRRYPTPEVPLNLEERGPWISLQTRSYRRVNAFTLQPFGPSSRNRNELADRVDRGRPSAIREPCSSSGSASSRRAWALDPYEVSLGTFPPPVACRRSRCSSATLEALVALISLGKRPSLGPGNLFSRKGFPPPWDASSDSGES
ncbi:hypothetical protein LINGRAHAP2_LOCUS4021 [Linum grandiflorum]